MIKAVIFDIGGVIVDFDKSLFLNKLAEHSPYSSKKLKKMIYDDSDIDITYQKGFISSARYYYKLKDLCKLSMSMDEFAEAYGKIHKLRECTIELIKKLRKNYRLHLLSNTGEWNYTHDMKHMGFERFFPTRTFSYEVGAYKPEEKMYIDALNKVRCKPFEAVYIDDIKEYSDKAQALGMNAIHYQSHGSTVKQLEKLGVKI